MGSIDDAPSLAPVRLRRGRRGAAAIAVVVALVGCGDNGASLGGGPGGDGAATGGATSPGRGGGPGSDGATAGAGAGGATSAGGGPAVPGQGGNAGGAGASVAVGGAGGGRRPDADACAAAPCHNGGLCQARADGGGFTCACAPGFTGVTCAANIDDCAASPCRNGGACQDGVAGFTCACPATFTGARCELPRFQSSGNLTPCGGPVTATGISADGRVVIGYCGSHHGFAWTAADGFLDLGIGEPPITDSLPFAVNADGSAVLSRFTRSDGKVGVLKASPGAPTVDQLYQAADAGLYANAASRDLSIVVGALSDPQQAGNQFAVRWTWAAGLVNLMALPASMYGCGAFGVSADGGVAAGACYDGDNILRAVRWTTAAGTTTIAAIDLQTTSTYANGVSGDGSALFGYVVVDHDAHFFRFRGDGPLEDLGALPQAETATAAASSDDGRVLVGAAEHTSYPFTDYAAVWDEQNGMRTVAGALTALGIDLTGWSLTSAAAVSADGGVIVGSGTSPDNVKRFWIARLY